MFFSSLNITSVQDEAVYCYATTFRCFLQAPYGFITFYGPVVACVIFNIFIFCRIAWSISRNQSMGTKVAVSDMERRKVSQGQGIVVVEGKSWADGFLVLQKQFKFAVTVMSLLGVAWVFGFFLIFFQNNMIWMRYIFILLNSTQVSASLLSSQVLDLTFRNA